MYTAVGPLDLAEPDFADGRVTKQIGGSAAGRTRDRAQAPSLAWRDLEKAADLKDHQKPTLHDGSGLTPLGAAPQRDRVPLRHPTRPPWS